MRQSVTFRAAASLLLAFLSAAIVLQVAVLSGLVPAQMTWGGRAQDDQERVMGAAVALFVLALAMWVVLARMGRFGPRQQGLSRFGAWALTALFVLNTLGNLAASDLRETLIFTPITLVLALLAWRVAVGEGPAPSA